MTWLVVLWALAAAGRLAPRRAPVSTPASRLSEPDLEVAGRV
jgi:hypothetical protein